MVEEDELEDSELLETDDGTLGIVVADDSSLLGMEEGSIELERLPSSLLEAVEVWGSTNVNLHALNPRAAIVIAKTFPLTIAPDYTP